MSVCRLLVDPPADGAWNMAADERLLTAAPSAAQSDAAPTLRLYGWREPTLSLGYFQAHADRRSHAASGSCPVVRRSSGGGAIVHDRELTYSLVLPSSHAAARDTAELYRRTHAALVAALGSLTITGARLCGETVAEVGPTEPFLCFARRSPLDVLLDGEKIAGSAQRRRRTAILQHGSVLLGRSTMAAELPGVAELTGRTLTAVEFADAWLPKLAAELGLKWSQSSWTADERTAIQRLAEDQFTAAHWTLRR